MKKYCYFLLLLLLGSVTGAYSQSKTISGGNDHGLIICAQGYLYTWGNNYSTTIGGPLLGIDPDISGNTPTATYVYSPQRVKTGNLTFGMVTSGSGAFNLALSCHKVVYAWGSNDTKACGQDATSGPVVEYPVPVLKGETPGYDEQGNPGGNYLGGVVYLAASTNSGFAIMDDGRVVGWGQGQWNPNTGAAAGLPAYIKDKNGNDLQNITHISGGDDNCLLRDANGNLYGIGPWNGNIQTTVTYAVPVLKADDGTPLTDIRMSAAGDVCGFAVTGDGYVWSWGNGGWGGSTGVSQSGLTHYNAMKVSSGEYQTISNEEYLTDVKEVIGGRGHGAAVTKEGYLVYWGCNDGNGGVVPTDAATALTYASGAQGVKPILAKYCDASGKPSKVVTDAVSISRGDNFDFMVNDKDDYYVWGLNDLGQTGTGVTTVDKYNCLIKLETIPCEIQDGCPQVFMIDRVKCPGEEIELDCGFVVPIGKEKRYYIEWYYNGTKLNTSTIKKGVAGNWVYDSSYDSDPYNKASILITDPGMYKVIAYYVGVNIPCDACEPDETEIEVTDMPMPIDTTITNMNCVALPLSPSQTDNICFKAVTNNKFYKATDNVKFAVFSTKDKTDSDTIDVIQTTGAGGVISFCLSGDKIKDIEDNKAKVNPDTIYNIWLEDISKFETYLREGAPGAAAQGGSFQSYGMLLDMYASADLESFDVYCKSYSGTSSISITPTIYKAEKNTNGIYVVGSVFWQGDAQTFSIDASGPNKCTVKCDARIPGSSARGVRYILGMSLTGNCTTYEYAVGPSKQNSPEYVTPLEDTEKFGIYEMGQTANSYTTMSNGGKYSCYYNVKFGKLTDYDCGRIQLSARYGCPPCNKPDVKASGKYVEIEPSQAAVDDTVRLCKESAALVLEVNDVKNTVEPTAKFDILWFDSYADLGVEANATKSETATTSSITVNWADITLGETKTYYVMVRDNEKTDASACYVFDSIKVKADTVPVVPEITVDPFCEGSLSSADLAAIEAKFTFAGYNADIQNEAGASLTLAALVSEISSLTAGTYKYTVTLTDAVTGCVSEPKSTSFEVWANPSETLDATTPFCEGVATSLPDSKLSYTVTWYSDAIGSATAETNLSSLTGKTTPYEYYYAVTDANGCISDTLAYNFTVKPYATVEFDTTMVCGVTTVKEKNVLPTDATLTWTLAGTAVSTTTFAEPTYTGDLGELSVFASSSDYCNSDTAKIAQLHVMAVPTAPTGTKTVTYLLTDAANGFFKNLLDQNSAAVDIATGYTYNWYAENGTSLGTTVPTPAVPASSITEDQIIKYTVTRTNADGCESQPMDVTVTIYLTPAPSTVPVEYCLNSTSVQPLTATINDPNNSGGFNLQWYDTDKTTKLTTAPTPDVTVNGESTYYVSQVSTQGAESSLVPLTVTVYDVDLPTLDNANVLKYCSNETAKALNATINSDATKYLMGDKLVWSLEGTETTNVTPNTAVTQTTTYNYSVYQTYTIPSSSEVCKGKEVATSVKVTFVPAVKTESVLYLKADASNGTFAKNILQQNANAVTGIETGATLKWYASDCQTEIIGTPTPTIDPSIPEGTDQEVSYCVSQVVDGCESEKVTVEVTISDAPVPTVNNLSYCEGETASPLEATINTMVAPASEYQLLWYDENMNSLASAPTPSTALKSAGDKTSDYVFYVTQKNLTTNAESSPAKITVTVNALPVLTIDNSTKVCETTVDIADLVKPANEDLTYVKTYFSDQAGMTTISSSVAKSGTYYVRYTYDVQSATGEVCMSKIEPITVVIDTLSAKCDDVTTCPEMSAVFNVVAESNVGSIAYTWTGTGDAGTGAAFTTKKFTGSNYGDTFDYTLEVTSGTCTEKITAKVTLGFGPVVGTLTLADAENTEKPSVVFNGKPADPFYFCGNTVTVTPAYTKDAGTSYTMKSPDGQVTTGATFSATEKGIYTLEFSNGCPTSVDFEIKDASIEIKHAQPQVLEMCEGETFTAKLNVTHADPDYTTAWYKDGVVLDGNTDDNFSISQTVKSDGGLYKAVSTSHGCVSEDEIGELKVKTYIQFTNQTEPYIVTRGDEVTIPIQITEPSSGTVASVIWSENGVQAASGKENTLTVTSDHKYDIVMSDPDHCDATTTAEVWVDAKLVLSTAFEDSLCYGESREFTIDTTGTGRFRDGTFVLSVMEVQNGSVTNVTNKFSLVGGKLTADFAPTKDATYTVHYSYKNQDTTAVEKIQVLQPIDIVLANEQTVCEGTEATIKLASVSPVGTTIAWDADPTITGSLDTDEITVTAEFPVGTVGNRARYAYNFTASYSICEDKKMTAFLNVDKPITGSVNAKTPICQGASTVLDASSFNAATYVWTKENDSIFVQYGPSIAANLFQSTTFKVNMTRGACKKDTTFDVEVTSLPVIVGIDSTGIRSRKVTLDPNYGTAPFKYAVDGFSYFQDDYEFKGLKYMSHMAYVVDAVGCTAQYPFVMIAPGITPNPFVTPTGDGINDVWVVTNLQDVYPDAVVRIYDRFGKKLAEYKGADAGWDGTYQGKEMPTTDYWYEIEIEEINKTYVGHFTLLRR